VRPGVPDLVLRAARGVALGGVLRDAAGAPAPRVPLLAEPLGSGVPLPPWAARGAFTDERGRFLVRGLPRGEVRLTATRDGTAVDLGVRRAPDADLEVLLPGE
jgi:hypothetical protein